MSKKKEHGGSRQNAGRKRKYNEETMAVTIRVPVSLVVKFKLMAAKWMNEGLKK